MSGWTALRLTLPETLEDAALGVLSEGGTLGVSFDVEGASGAQAASRRATAYFPDGADLLPVRAALDRLGLGPNIETYRVGDEAWVERQEASRTPLRIGIRFEVLPAPARDGGGEGRIRLIIPPKRAFGTGEHATTRLCLELLETLDVTGRRVLDFGTGSGVLALAARALGAESVVAVDEDPEAVEMARENLALNGAMGESRPIQVVEGTIEAAAGCFDLVLANILAGVLEDAASRLAALQGAGGRAILSGFSPGDAGAVASTYRAAGYRVRERRASGDWAALLLERCASRDG